MPNQINYNLQYPVTLKHKEHVYVTKIDLYIEAALILYLGTSLMFLLDNKKTVKGYYICMDAITKSRF